MPIDWDDDPRSARIRNKCQLERVPRSGKIDAVCISEACVAVWTHYYGGRTQPCSGSGCDMCEAQGTRRRHVYAAIWRPATGKITLLEVTENAGVELLEKKAGGEVIRGRRIIAFRLNARVNAPVELNLREDLASTYQLPDAPNIRDSLRIIWHLADDPSAYTDAEKVTRVKPHMRKRKGTNGTGREEPIQADGPQQPGGLRSANGVHLPPKEAGGFPSRSTIEPADD